MGPSTAQRGSQPVQRPGQCSRLASRAPERAGTIGARLFPAARPRRRSQTLRHDRRRLQKVAGIDAQSICLGYGAERKRGAGRDPVTHDRSAGDRLRCAARATGTCDSPPGRQAGFAVFAQAEPEFRHARAARSHRRAVDTVGAPA